MGISGWISPQPTLGPQTTYAPSWHQPTHPVGTGTSQARASDGTRGLGPTFPRHLFPAFPPQPPVPGVKASAGSVSQGAHLRDILTLPR